MRQWLRQSWWRHANKTGDGIGEFVSCASDVVDVACKFEVEGRVIGRRGLAGDLIPNNE